MTKKNYQEMTSVDLRDYYHSLSRKEKGKFLSYLVTEFGFSYSTMVNKLSGRYHITKPESFLLNLAVQQEEIWKR